MEVHHYLFGFTIFLCVVTFSQTDKPSGLSQGVYCEGCIATVKELLKKINKKTGESREVRVIEALEDICNLQNFGSYEYSPPKTGQACKFLIENYDEEIENSLVSESGDFEQKICYELTEACKGVDRTRKEKEELEVNINDKKQKLETGSSEKDPEQFNVNINEEGAAEKLVNQINMAVKNKKNGGDDDAESDDENKIDEDADLDDDNDEDIENLADNLEDTKTEL